MVTIVSTGHLWWKAGESDGARRVAGGEPLLNRPGFIDSHSPSPDSFSRLVGLSGNSWKRESKSFSVASAECRLCKSYAKVRDVLVVQLCHRVGIPPVVRHHPILDYFTRRLYQPNFLVTTHTLATLEHACLFYLLHLDLSELLRYPPLRVLEDGSREWPTCSTRLATTLRRFTRA